MAKTTKKQENKIVTRAEKKDAAKNVIKELLAISPQKHNELIEETARIYTARFGGGDTENINDVKGRIGSVLDIMKKEGEIMYDGGRYALKSRLPENPMENSPEIPPEINLEKATETPVKKPRGRAKKAAQTEEVKTPEIADTGTEKPKKTAKKAEQAEKTEKSEKEGADKPEIEAKPKKAAKTAKTAKAKSEKKGKEEEAQPLPPAPLQPIAPVAPVTPEIAPEPLPEQEKTEDKPAKKTVRSRVKKSVAKEETKPEIPTETEEKTPPLNVEEKAKEGTEEKSETAEKAETAEQTGLQPLPIVKEKAEIAKKTEVMDMSFLFGATPVQKTEKSPEKPVQKTEERAETKAEESVEEKPVVKQEKLALKVVKTEEKRAKKVVQTLRKTEAKPQTADERLKEAFLRKLRSLGGDYFEYYSVYLLERYSMKNGRRLEGMKISGGDRDGGIDGEIELTDKFGFRETIYIQSKNWNPDKGDERLWVVGETLLQQFIGACACRQAQDKKQHCRGIFVTTSRFTPDAKRILETMSDKIVGYDGEDLYEAAKECSFGLKYENGNWKLDEKLLSGTKAFFTML